METWHLAAVKEKQAVSWIGGIATRFDRIKE